LSRFSECKLPTRSLCAGLLFFGSWLSGQAQVSPNVVTPVSGESWLNHLHRSFEETSMGKTGHLGPAPETLLFEPAASDGSGAARELGYSPEQVALHGADLYRLSCQGCHGESGLGAPPEIGSVINPVRATSAAMVMARMASVGAPMSRAQAIELSGESAAALRKRIHDGGKDMPAFPHLTESEVRALTSYLEVLAGVPGASDRAAIAEPRTRVGELIVKSTCHTCHDATGANPTPEQLAAGMIPPLSTLTARTTPEGLVRKVTHGAAVTMGDPPFAERGRMPVFFYVSSTEAADVYDYLSAFTPTAGGASVATAANTASMTVPPKPVRASLAAGAMHAASQEDSSQGWSTSLVALGVISILVLGTMGGGFLMSVREVQRLATEARFRKRTPVLRFPPQNSTLVGKQHPRPESVAASVDQHDLAVNHESKSYSEQHTQ
jgi:mono/diheme cytochrome c family protein